MRRPPTKTIKRVVSWLEDHGLSVYGPASDLDKKEVYPGCMDYSADKAIAYAKLLDQKKLKEVDHDD